MKFQDFHLSNRIFIFTSHFSDSDEFCRNHRQPNYLRINTCNLRLMTYDLRLLTPFSYFSHHFIFPGRKGSF